MKRLQEVERGEVFRGEERVGVIDRTRQGARFAYDAGFLERHRAESSGAALHLPFATPVVDTPGVNLHSYFAGLLPEGLRLRSLVSQLKTSEDDLFTLLIAAGSDTIGDLSVVPAGRAPLESSPTMSVGALRKTLFADLLRESLKLSGGRTESALPGVQEKVSASMISFPVQARRGAKRWILKLTPPNRPRLVENEALFMRLAGQCGLDVAATQLVHDREGNAGLLVERFDRRWNERDQKVERIHQEDACQILDRYPADKYRIRCREIAEALRVCVAPAQETMRFLQLVAFSYLIGNGDLHAKNVSISRLGPAQGFRLTPAYDLLSTWPYGDRKMALQVEGRLDNLRVKDFVALAARSAVSEAAVRAMLASLVRKAPLLIDGVDQIGLDPRQTGELRRLIRKRAEGLGKGSP